MMNLKIINEKEPGETMIVNKKAPGQTKIINKKAPGETKHERMVYFIHRSQDTRTCTNKSKQGIWVGN